ncbi:hypothetical protein [Streptomyces sp. MST-110588]|uniref:hypothetical protein n=1 Tax=Streptomyces sp. MST-110588 TaxID=2833628 RepID=UPI001F5CE0BF|nr:hypothetical protein [Streptomyces sp. MST-110588]UNO40354.1 hypothetical protein KGS77_13145 [Streptomyces sp. MST-110588]
MVMWDGTAVDVRPVPDPGRAAAEHDGAYRTAGVALVLCGGVLATWIGSTIARANATLGDFLEGLFNPRASGSPGPLGPYECAFTASLLAVGALALARRRVARSAGLLLGCLLLVTALREGVDLMHAEYRDLYGRDPLGDWALATRALSAVVALTVLFALLPATERHGPAAGGRVGAVLGRVASAFGRGRSGRADAERDSGHPDVRSGRTGPGSGRTGPGSGRADSGCGPGSSGAGQNDSARRGTDSASRRTPSVSARTGSAFPRTGTGSNRTSTGSGRTGAGFDRTGPGAGRRTAASRALGASAVSWWQRRLSRVCGVLLLIMGAAQLTWTLEGPKGVHIHPGTNLGSALDAAALGSVHTPVSGEFTALATTAVLLVLGALALRGRRDVRGAVLVFGAMQLYLTVRTVVELTVTGFVGEALRTTGGALWLVTTAYELVALTSVVVLAMGRGFRSYDAWRGGPYDGDGASRSRSRARRD